MKSTTGSRKLDKVDLGILNALMEDAHMPYALIGERVHASEATVHVRLKKMHGAGFISGQQLIPNYAALGIEICAFLGIFLEKGKDYEPVLQALKEIPQVTEAHYVTGAFGIFCKIMCQNTEKLKSILYNDIQSIEGIQRTETIISLDNPISRPLHLSEGF